MSRTYVSASLRRGGMGFEWSASGFDGSVVSVGLFGTIVVIGTGWTNWLF